MEVIQSENPIETTAKLVGDALHAYVGTPLLVLVSGGSWHAVLEHIDTTKLGPWCTLTCLDERFSSDPVSNNFDAMTRLRFFSDAVKQGVHVISTHLQPEDTRVSLQLRFDHALQAWQAEHPHGNSLALMGVGSDGHIAGIFPELLEVEYNDRRLTQSYTVTSKAIVYPERITVSEYFLTQIVDQAIVYASGEDKKEIIAKLVTEGSSLPAPAQILQVMQKVTLSTDYI